MERGRDGDAGDDRLNQMIPPATRMERALPSGRPEILLVGAPAEVARAEAEIEEINGEVLRRRAFGELGLGVSAVDIGGLMTPPILRARLALRGIDVTLDRNAIYAMSGNGRSYVRPMVGLPDGTACSLGRKVRIGLIDGPVDQSNPAIAEVPVVSRSVLDDDEIAASADHATGACRAYRCRPRCRSHRRDRTRCRDFLGHRVFAHWKSQRNAARPPCRGLRLADRRARRSREHVARGAPATRSWRG